MAVGSGGESGGEGVVARDAGEPVDCAGPAASHRRDPAGAKAAVGGSTVAGRAGGDLSWPGGGLSLRAIAAELGRPPSTVSREVLANGGRASYRATAADRAAWFRAARPKATKLAMSLALAELVAAKLELDWSPQQIAGWLKLEFPDDGLMQVSPESIYVTPRPAPTRSDAAPTARLTAISGALSSAHSPGADTEGSRQQSGSTKPPGRLDKHRSVQRAPAPIPTPPARLPHPDPSRLRRHRRPTQRTSSPDPRLQDTITGTSRGVALTA